MKKLDLNFDKYNKKEWLDIISKSMKKGNIDDFIWELDEGVYGEPFAHSDDIEPDLFPLMSKNKDNNWMTGLDYSLIRGENFNDYIKQHLLFGLKSVIVNIPSSKIDLEQLFNGIDLENINLIFNTRYGVELILFLENLKDYFVSRKIDYKKIKFTLRLPVNRPKLINEIYNYSSLNFPELMLYLKTDRSYSYHPVQYLSETFNTITEFVIKSEASKEMTEWLFERLKIHFFMSGNFLADIATIRAFKILWNNYLKAYKIKSKEPQIIIGINHDSFTDDENNDLIVLTTLCMSGAIAGVQAINIAPRENDIKDPKNTMRLILNIQNIMKLESNMDIVKDSLVGSYAIEDATNKLVKEAWKGFE